PEVIACATRSGGVAATFFPPKENGQISSSSLPGLDIVDVCPLGRELAVGAVAKDCTLGLFRDVLHDHPAFSFKFDNIKGTAYRLLRSQGHLFLLTSSSIYILEGLARRFLEGKTVERPMRIPRIPVEAVDMNLADDRWLLVVTADNVLRIDI